MQTFDGQTIAAGDILSHVRTVIKPGENPGLVYQGVIGIHFGTNVWLTDESETIEGVDFNSRKNLLNENTIQLCQYELVTKGGDNNE